MNRSTAKSEFFHSPLSTSNIASPEPPNSSEEVSPRETEISGSYHVLPLFLGAEGVLLAAYSYIMLMPSKEQINVLNLSLGMGAMGLLVAFVFYIIHRFHKALDEIMESDSEIIAEVNESTEEFDDQSSLLTQVNQVKTYGSINS